MIKYKHAPAGYIAQFYTDEKLPFPGASNQDYRDNHYMHVCGEWCPTLEGAIESVKKQRPKEVKKLQKKLALLETKVKEMRDWIKSVEDTSTDVQEEQG